LLRGDRRIVAFDAPAQIDDVVRRMRAAGEQRECYDDPGEGSMKKALIHANTHPKQILQ
jgi:hypothetical protein